MSSSSAKVFLTRFFFGDGVSGAYFDRVVNAANMVLSSVLIWTIFTLVFNNNMPLVVVLSNSMEPDFIRGDLLLAVSPPPGSMFPNGEICAYNIRTSPVPIVHRMIETHKYGQHKLILTKGDNNPTPDNFLYQRGEEFYYNDNVETQLVAVLPKLGWVSIVVKEKKSVAVVFIIILFWNSFRDPDS
ncbi:Clan SF, family S26, signal peptidase I-like serine peptidase [Trichomonas vaginalis G3]|uniref:Signal peptidase complex catalytic subunit SEC11 n=1 Tax=Trichomonas vaginalis (strain ATCC PRA-98 / G3) TaxID=412133 RepID=A2EJC9_TRIV3|nr:signal peptide processing [Trichomonas vaginalis G3]EAY07281.1 Clan SF, family S26, signal peptidase I-like serine peptidase [Trichomonas vaginalis G3]KAI5511947.1 signal peptide processing [Trichomonas vaginalis G3]|eukprot:XP_001319504.1 Clan SF, family S26, signal peptidase I-like serine peptidase [Trichomonas vaginalis G3]